MADDKKYVYNWNVAGNNYFVRDQEAHEKIDKLTDELNNKNNSTIDKIESLKKSFDSDGIYVNKYKPSKQMLLDSGLNTMSIEKTNPTDPSSESYTLTINIYERKYNDGEETI